MVPELGVDLGAEERRRAVRASTVQTVHVPPGPWSPEELPAREQPPFGLLVADGAMMRDILLAGSVASDLLGPGDVAALAESEDALVPAPVRWTASAPSSIVILEPGLLAALEAWPGVAARLLARSTRQTSNLALQRASSQLPRVDQRLLALFWLLAERWGRVGQDGIVVRLALTHEALGRMVGARRPTVSLALKELAVAGTVVRRTDGAWVLRHDGLGRLAPVDAEGWQPPDTALLPESEPVGEPATPLASAPLGDAVLSRVRELDLSYADRQERVREVLARCADTREQLILARQRRASMRHHPGQIRPPR